MASGPSTSSAATTAPLYTGVSTDVEQASASTSKSAGEFQRPRAESRGAKKPQPQQRLPTRGHQKLGRDENWRRSATRRRGRRQAETELRGGPDMYRLHGFFTQNSMKALYVLEELGVDYEFCFVDLAKGENRTDSFRRKTPAGRVPVLEHDGEFLFESGAICRYVAGVEHSPLFPADKLERARVDQWMTY
jgi:hypothetical protein